ncbi:MAG: transporter substrate-binding domain-containing protein [Verrucomicrobiae bacterium]|nr:transporter substrate-binding domain-containing protein [Verrucomicrobiae bacterium]
MSVSRLFTLASSLALVFLSSCGPSRDDNALVVGMEMAYPPFEMRGTDNQPDGISVRMAEDLAAHLGRPLRLEDVAWDGIIPSLKSEKIDLIISSMTRTDERAESIDFSDGYVTNGLCMLVAKDSKIESVDDLQESNAKVAVKLGTTGHTWAQGHLEGVELVVLDEASVCALEVAQGKADAFIYDQISIYKQWQTHAETTRPILKPIREETWAIGIRKGDEEMRTQVNAWLSEYRAAGRFDELAERYMAAEKKSFEEMGVPFIFH